MSLKDSYNKGKPLFKDGVKGLLKSQKKVFTKEQIEASRARVTAELSGSPKRPNYDHRVPKHTMHQVIQLQPSCPNLGHFDSSIHQTNLKHNDLDTIYQSDIKEKSMNSGGYSGSQVSLNCDIQGKIEHVSGKNGKNQQDIYKSGKDSSYYGSLQMLVNESDLNRVSLPS